MKINDIITKISSELNLLTGAGQPFDYIYDYNTIEGEGYPYVSFESASSPQEIEDTTNNNRTIIFDIFIYQEFNKKTRQEADKILNNGIDAIDDHFSKNYTLDGLVTQILPPTWEKSEFNGEKGKVLFANIQLQIQFLKNINN